VYGLDTYNHTMCVHFHHLLNMELSTCLQLVSTTTFIGITSCATKFSQYIYYSPIFCDWFMFNCCVNDIPLHCNSRHRSKSTFELRLKAMCIFYQTFNKGVHMDIFLYISMYFTHICSLFTM
jgi:hypothetical protein